MQTFTTKKTVSDILFGELHKVRLPESHLQQLQTFNVLFEIMLEAKWPTDALVKIVEYCIQNDGCKVIELEHT
jgi:hypothetical protein